MYVTLVTQHALRMPRTVMSSMTGLALPYFSSLPRKGTILGRKKVTENKVRVLILSATLF
jgi:hypothetical protein